MLGLVDRRTLHHPQGKPAAETLLPRHIRQHIVGLALAYPFTARELARIIRDGFHNALDDRGIHRVLAQHHLSPETLRLHHQRVPSAMTTRVPVQVIMGVLQLLDNNPLLGHYRVKMALDALGYRYGHTTVWQVVALDTQAHPTPPREKRTPNLDERPHQATAPPQVWCADLRYLVKIEGRWL